MQDSNTRYFLWSGQAADKFGWAVYEVDGKVINCTSVALEDWKERYLWPDTQVVAVSDNWRWLETIEGPESQDNTIEYNIKDFFENRV